MRFLLAAALLAMALVMLFVLGLFGANPGVTMLGFCTFAGIGNPLLWVAVYRFFSAVYKIVPRQKV